MNRRARRGEGGNGVVKRKIRRQVGVKMEGKRQVGVKMEGKRQQED